MSGFKKYLDWGNVSILRNVLIEEMSQFWFKESCTLLYNFKHSQTLSNDLMLNPYFLNTVDSRFYEHGF